jgi:hypothetical protein
MLNELALHLYVYGRGFILTTQVIRMSLAGDASLQDKMRLGEVVDIYYYGTKTLEKQAIPTVQDTRFLQALPAKGAGSSTFIISPDQGVSDVLLAVQLPVQAYNGLALPRGWLYRMIRQVSVRYGGSSQYFFTGEQILVQNLRECTSPSTRDALFELGGAELLKPLDFQGDSLYAYVPLNLPHSSPNGGLEKPNPFPTELLNQPIVITVEMANPADAFIVASPAVAAQSAAPTQFEDAWFQIRQIHAHDAGALMRPMGAGAGYSYPLKAFYQNEIQVQLTNSAAEQNITLTGFRAGDVRSIFFWVEDKDKTAAGNKFAWALPRDIQLLYNGTVYMNFKGTSSQIWDLMNTDVPSQVLNSEIVQSGSGVAATAFTSNAIVSNWIQLPFSQVYEQLSGTHLMVRGKMIENAVVNVSLKMPGNTLGYVLHAVYAYNALLFCSAGSAEYVF